MCIVVVVVVVVVIVVVVVVVIVVVIIIIIIISFLSRCWFWDDGFTPSILVILLLFYLMRVCYISQKPLYERTCIYYYCLLYFFVYLICFKLIKSKL